MSPDTTLRASWGLRIVILNNFAYVTGGADRHCLDIAALLRERGHEVAFLSTASAQNLEDAGEFVPLLVTNATRDALSPAARIRVARAAVWNGAAAAAMERTIREFSPDVVHAHKVYPQLSVAPVRVAAREGIPVVQTAHDYEYVSASPVDSGGGRVDRNESRFAYRALNSVLFAVKRRLHVPSVAAWVTVSRAVAAVYARAGVDAVVLPNFTRLGSDRRPGFDDRDGAVYVGQLNAVKGVEDVIAVARAMPGLRVRVAGHGKLEGLVRAAAAELANLEYLGMLSAGEVQAALAGSRVSLMPSRWDEPGPLASLEAMATGTPVVAYDRGGLAEYVSDAGAGRVVPTDPDALAAAARELTEDRVAWEAASRAGLEASAGAHSRERYAEALERVYESAMAAQRPA